MATLSNEVISKQRMMDVDNRRKGLADEFRKLFSLDLSEGHFLQSWCNSYPIWVTKGTMCDLRNSEWYAVHPEATSIDLCKVISSIAAERTKEEQARKLKLKGAKQ